MHRPITDGYTEWSFESSWTKATAGQPGRVLPSGDQRHLGAVGLDAICRGVAEGPFATANHADSCQLKSSGPLNERPGTNEVSR